MAKKTVKESTETIRTECDNIDEEIEDKGGRTRGDPVAELF